MIAAVLRFVMWISGIAFLAGLLSLVIFTAYEVFGWEWYEGRGGYPTFNVVFADADGPTPEPGSYGTVMWQYALMTAGYGLLGSLLYYFVGEREEAVAEDEYVYIPDPQIQLPAWLEELSDEDLALVTSDKDYYQVLDVDPSASPEEVKRAYRTLARRHHPDTTESGEVDGRMAEINEAYRVLGNPGLRHAYDHADELAFALTRASAEEGVSGAAWYCTYCGFASDEYEQMSEHVAWVHFMDESIIAAAESEQ